LVALAPPNIYPMFVTADMFQAPMGWLKASAPKNMVLAFHQPIGAWDTSAMTSWSATAEYNIDFKFLNAHLRFRYQSVGLRH